MKPAILIATGLALLALLGLSSLPAQAQAYVSGYGDEYTITSNRSGTVLTSVYPKTRQVGTGAFITEEKGPEIVFIGKDCDAFSKYLG